MTKTVAELLDCIGIDNASLVECSGDLKEEFIAIKKQYFAKILVSHPDKGGDPEVFRQVQTAFEVLRELYTTHASSSSYSFASSTTTAQAAESYDHMWADVGQMPTPSWDYFASAAKDFIPTYRVELAKSGRSKCKQKGKAKKCGGGGKGSEVVAIDQGTVRIGWFNKESGAYGNWVHLQCWRVPSRVWLGLPQDRDNMNAQEFESALLGMNEVLLCGYNELPDDDRQAVTEYTMNRDNWARLTKRKQATAQLEDGDDDDMPHEAGAASAMASTAMVPTKSKFVLPIPGQDGAVPNVLQGKTIVLTGVFPEVGGGAGLSLGKDRLKSMLESFGARVTGSVSGRTDLLIVGKEPGMSKVSQARERPKISLLGIRDLLQVIQGNVIEDVVGDKPMLIKDFSIGYTNRKDGPNGLALKASPTELAIAQGLLAPPGLLDEKPAAAKKPAAKKGKSKAVGDKKPAAKKRKAAPKKKKAAPKKKKAKTALAIQAFSITCDSCGKDCTERSWFVAANEQDYCPTCIEGKQGVEQSNGIAIDG